MRVGLGRIGVVGHAPDDEGALAEHLQEGNLAESRGRHALLLHLGATTGGRKMSVAVRAECEKITRRDSRPVFTTPSGDARVYPG